MRSSTHALGRFSRRLADLWTNTLEAEEYVEFLEDLLTKMKVAGLGVGIGYKPKQPSVEAPPSSPSAASTPDDEQPVHRPPTWRQTLHEGMRRISRGRSRWGFTIGGREPNGPMRVGAEQQLGYNLNYEPDRGAHVPRKVWGQPEVNRAIEADSLEEWIGATLASHRVAEELRQTDLVTTVPCSSSTAVHVMAGAPTDKPPQWVHSITRRQGLDEPMKSRPRRHSLPSLRSSGIGSLEDSVGAFPVAVGELGIPLSTLSRRIASTDSLQTPSCAHKPPSSFQGHKADRGGGLQTELPAALLHPPDVASRGPYTPAMLANAASFSEAFHSALRPRRHSCPELRRSPSQLLHGVPKASPQPAPPSAEPRAARFVLVDAGDDRGLDRSF